MVVFNSVFGQMDVSLAEMAHKNSLDGVAESGSVKITYQFNIRAPVNRVSKTKFEVLTMKKYP